MPSAVLLPVVKTENKNFFVGTASDNIIISTYAHIIHISKNYFKNFL